MDRATSRGGAGLLALLSVPAFAQEAPSPGGPPPGLEDIVVTAQRRSENLQDVPVSVSAVTSSQLAKAGAISVLDLRVSVPTLNVVNTNGYLSSSLRGIGSNGVGPGIESPVALYVDGVYIASQFASALSLNNIARVEVLKGPQGTLFGRNATGGLIQVLTRDPSDGPAREISLSYGNYQTIAAGAYLAQPFSDSLAADLAIQYRHQGDGYGRNLTTGSDIYRLDHDFSARSKIVFKPADGSKLTLILDYSDVKDSLNGIKSIDRGPFTIQPLPGQPPSQPKPAGRYDLSADLDPGHFGHNAGASFRWDQEFGALRFVSLTSYRRSLYTTPFDFDFSSNRIREILPRQRDSQFSQELQLGPRDGGRLKWLVGLYYFDWNSEYDPLQLNFFDAGAQITIRQKERSRSIAGFAQATYEVFDRTNLTVGARYTTDKRSVPAGTQSVFVVPIQQTINADLPPVGKRFNKVTWRVSLDHRFSDAVLAYASWNRGFRAGGFSIQGATQDFDPETIDAYEAGLKTDLFGRTVRINVSGFYYDYKNIQVQAIRPGGIIAIVNGSSARDYGLDADAIWLVTRDFRLTGGLGLVNAKFRSFPNCLVSRPAGNQPSAVGSCAGNRLPLAARTTFNLGADYTVHLDRGSVNFNTTAYRNSGFAFESDNVIRQPGFWSVNASATWTLPGDQLSVSGFVKNLTNDRPLTFVGTDSGLGYHYGIYAPPRTYGVTLSLKM